MSFLINISQFNIKLAKLVPDPHPEHFITGRVSCRMTSLSVRCSCPSSPRQDVSISPPSVPLQAVATQLRPRLLWLCSPAAPCAAPRALAGSPGYSDKKKKKKNMRSEMTSRSGILTRLKVVHSPDRAGSTGARPVLLRTWPACWPQTSSGTEARTYRPASRGARARDREEHTDSSHGAL